MHPYAVLSRLLMFALTAAACLWLTSRVGPWAALAVWAAAIGLLCSAAAFLLYKQAPGRITIINRVAGILLPWGYSIGRGKLVPVVIESSVRWVLLGIAIVVLTPHGLAYFGSPAAPSIATAPAAAYQPSTTIAVLLLLSWVVAAAVLLRLLTFMVTRSSPRSAGSLTPILGIGALLVASVALAVFGRSAATTYMALALAGGPILLIGGGYGLMLLVMLTVGRNARWN